jgi:hypothetical protein
MLPIFKDLCWDFSVREWCLFHVNISSIFYETLCFSFKGILGIVLWTNFVFSINVSKIYKLLFGILLTVQGIKFFSLLFQINSLSLFSLYTWSFSFLNNFHFHWIISQLFGNIFHNFHYNRRSSNKRKKLKLPFLLSSASLRFHVYDDERKTRSSTNRKMGKQ